MSTVAERLAAVRTELHSRCNTIEEAYEFMLAYAGQGLSSDSGSSKGAQVREFLTKAEAAMAALSTLASGLAGTTDAEFVFVAAFMDVVDRDARASRAAVAIVLALPGISSQVIDNLNASIHLRALLTDLFLVDEVLKGHK